MEWMILPLKRYFDFNGRSRRMEFWMFQLFYILAYLAMFFVFLGMFPWDAIGNTAGAADPVLPSPAFWIVFGLIMLFAIAMVIPQLSVSVRRLHDQDKSGWWLLLNFLPMGGIILFVLFFVEGTRGPNRYGPDPKDPHQARTFE